MSQKVAAKTKFLKNKKTNHQTQRTQSLHLGQDAHTGIEMEPKKGSGAPTQPEQLNQETDQESLAQVLEQPQDKGEEEEYVQEDQNQIQEGNFGNRSETRNEGEG